MSKKHQKKFGTSDSVEKAKEESLKNSQGTSSYKGSGYNGKGNVDSDKVILNRKRR